jgi:Domain of unknown function (DUF4271)
VKAILVFFLLGAIGCYQTHAQSNTTIISTALDSNNTNGINRYQNMVDSIHYLNTKGTPFAYQILPKSYPKDESYFYLILSLFFMLGITRTLFSKYFNTLFRVFFNTSLRQNQLTDQLEQSKLPSLLFNIFFVLAAGLYIYFLIQYFTFTLGKSNWALLFVIIASVATSYTVKYISLKFIGWVTNFQSEAKTYIFIIFLLNKVIGILLLPFIAIMAFSNYKTISYAVLFSIIGLSIVLVVRFFRSYSLLQSKLKVSRFHFFMYIIAIEVLPLILIYKVVMMYFTKNA